MGDDREKRWEDMEHVHGCFGEQEEHGEDADDEVEVCDAIFQRSACAALTRVSRSSGRGRRTIDPTLLAQCMVDSWLLRKVLW